MGTGKYTDTMSLQKSVGLAYRKLAILSVIAGFSIVGGQAVAQEFDSATQLRQEFRSALLQDPRTTSMSETEINSMVDALATKVEEENTVYDFILPPLPAPIVEFASSIVTPWGQPITPAVMYAVILCSLLLAVLLLWLLLHMHKHEPSGQ